MTSDSELLRQYAEAHSEEAFAQLVRRHLGLVYSAALRQVNGDAHLAQDVTQTVFTDLARKADALARRHALAGWLYTSTHFAAATAVRTERRRRTHEQEAHAMQELLHTPAADFDWERLCPVLDEAMHDLKDSDREAILMRYFECRQLTDVGKMFGLTEDAARKRVDRALEKLRAILSKRGVTTTAGLAAALSANAVQIPPAGLAATLTTASLAGAAVGTGQTLTLLKLMAMTKLKAGIIGVVLVASIAVPLALRHYSGTSSGQEQQPPTTPPAQSSATSPPAEPPAQLAATTGRNPPPANAYTRARNGTLPEIGPEQLSDYLEKNRRSAASLLAAFHITHDKALLHEAMAKYPNDSHVSLAASLEGGTPPEQRRQWLENFKRSAPDNALANYLSASEYLKSGLTTQAVQELTAASAKSNLQDYWFDSCQNEEEAYRAAGYSEAEAKAAAISAGSTTFLQLRELNRNLTTLVTSYRQAGDDASAQTIIQSGINLGQTLANPDARCNLAQYDVGMQIEQQFLSLMDPNSPLGNSSQTVKDQLAEISQRLAQFKELSGRQNTLLPALSDEDLANYADHMKVFGGLQALKWLVDKYPTQ